MQHRKCKPNKNTNQRHNNAPNQTKTQTNATTTPSEQHQDPKKAKHRTRKQPRRQKRREYHRSTTNVIETHQIVPDLRNYAAMAFPEELPEATIKDELWRSSQGSCRRYNKTCRNPCRGERGGGPPEPKKIRNMELLKEQLEQNKQHIQVQVREAEGEWGEAFSHMQEEKIFETIQKASST